MVSVQLNTLFVYVLDTLFLVPITELFSISIQIRTLIRYIIFLQEAKQTLLT